MILGTTPQSNIRPGVGSGVRARKCGEMLRYTPGHTLLPQLSSHMCIVGESMKTLGLVGGTFEFFHIGHQKLIETGLLKCKNLEIWIVSDNIAQQKDSRVQSWQKRCDNIKLNLTEIDNSRVSFHELVDEFGAATYHVGASVIICTSETMNNCVKINKIRAQDNLDELEIIEVPHVYSGDGEIISSTRIRNGFIDIYGNNWFDENPFTSDIHITKEAEMLLKEPFGTLFEGPESDHSIAIKKALDSISQNNSPIIGVGDVTVKSLQDIDNIANIALIDEKTKRVAWEGFREINQSLYDCVIECQNPPGMLTKSLFESCKVAINNWNINRSKTLIIVDGEEDLAPLLLHLLAPLNTAILYGQPNRGVVLRITGLDSKSRCQSLINLFEEK